MNKISLTLAALIFLCPGYLHANPLAFAENGAGARGISMGRAMISSVDDVSGIYWNPAGLTFMGRPQLLVSGFLPFSGTVGGISKNDLVTGFPLGTRASAGIGIIYESVKGIPRWTDKGEKSGEISTGEYLSMLAFGWRFNDRIRAGVTYKFIYKDYSVLEQKGHTLDAGIILIVSPLIRMGLSIVNAVPLKLNTASGSDEEYGSEFRAGLSVNPARMLTMSGAVSAGPDGRLKITAGALFKVSGSLSLTAGYMKDGGEITLGARFKFLELCTVYHPVLGLTNGASLNILF